MSDRPLEIAASIGTTVVGLAIVAVLVSRNSQTTSVLGTAFSGFAAIIAAAVSPVTGSGAGSGLGGLSSLTSGLGGLSGIGGGSIPDLLQTNSVGPGGFSVPGFTYGGSQ